MSDGSSDTSAETEGIRRCDCTAIDMNYIRVNGDLDMADDGTFENLVRSYGQYFETLRGAIMIHVLKDRTMIGILMINTSLEHAEESEIRQHVKQKTGEPGHGRHWAFMPA